MGKLLTIKEALKKLHCSERTLYRLIKRGDVVPYNPCGKNLFDEIELEKYIKSKRRRAA